ncbi:MAG TPA: SAVED domain-containing protein [Thermoanaerobaculia bacterium]
MDYQDFTLEIRPAGENRLEAAVIDASGPVTEWSPFPNPLSQEELDHLTTPPKESPPPPASQPREIGTRLYTALFQNQIGRLFQSRRDILRRGNEGLRLRLRLSPEGPEAAYLTGLPWEWLWDPGQETFLAIDLSTPVIRDFAVNSLERERTLAGDNPLLVDPPLRILVVDSSPVTESFLNLRKEMDRMAETFRPLIESGQVELLGLEEKTRGALRDALRDEGIHVLHFMGHGLYNPEAGGGWVILEKPGGQGDRVSGVTLANLLKSIPELRLVVLNACKTAQLSGCPVSPVNAGVAKALLEQARIPAVVAHQVNVSDAAAISFSNVFYNRLASGDSVEEALTETRLQMQGRNREWATPVLFLAGQSGKLFSLKKARGRSVYRLLDRLSRPIRLGIRSFDGWGKDMEDRNDTVLDLVKLFDGRKIRQPEDWQQEVLRRVREFLDRYVDERRPLVLDFAAHSSIAFAAGWLLEAKSGLDVRVRQRTQTQGEREWHPNEGEVPEGPMWLDLPDLVGAPEAPNLAAALSVTHKHVAQEVQKLVEREGLPIRRIIDASVPEPGQRSVRSGAHMLHLAEALLPRLRQRAPEERDSRLHLFYAGPNALQLYLGQLARSLGRIVLYEYDFDQPGAQGQYTRSIELPPPAEAAPGNL